MRKIDKETFISKFLNFVPKEYFSRELIENVYDKSIDFFEKQFQIDFGDENYDEVLKNAFSTIVSKKLAKNRISELIEVAPKVYTKTIHSTQNYIQRFIPWALVQCDIPYSYMDSYIWMILCAEFHYELIEDIIDKHNTASSVSAVYISKLFSILLNSANTFKSKFSKKIIDYILEYHDQFIHAELSEKNRSIQDTRNLWHNSNIISDKAAPARLLFTLPLILSGKENLVPEYEMIMDHWTIYLQILDDVVDIEYDLENHNFGIGISLFYYLKDQNYKPIQAIESIKYGTGLAICLERCKKELQDVITISLSINDLLVAYSALQRLDQIEYYIEKQHNLFN